MNIKHLVTRCLFLAPLLMISKAWGQEVIPLYPDQIPNSIPNAVQEEFTDRGGYVNVTDPTLEVYLPPEDLANGAAMIVLPGGGYVFLNYGNEGTRIAEAAASEGMAAFVLKYRLPNDATMEDKSIGPLQDAQQAIKIVRQRADEWGIDPDKIGILGFSAGGHLASTAGTHFDESLIPNEEGVSLRPDFMVLVYPVVTLIDDRYTHQGSKRALLGENPDERTVAYFSGERNVTPNTPPTYLTHASDDTGVPVQNSLNFYEALIDHGVPAEMHLYREGGHGFANSWDLDDWLLPVWSWLRGMGMFDRGT